MITFQVDAKDVLGRLALMHEKAPQVIAVGVNRTIEDGLVAMRGLVSTRFLVRVPLFALPPNFLPAKERATPKRLGAVLKLAYEEGRGSLGERRASLLSQFEEGGERVGKRYPRPIPTSALRPSPQTLIPRNVYPTALGFAGRRDASAKVTYAVRGRGAKGRGVKFRNRYFEVPLAAGPNRWGIYERTGPERGDIRMVWAYRERTRVPRRLGFYAEANRVAEGRYATNLLGAWDALIGRGR